MSRHRMLAAACAPLAVASCIQRTLVCPPVGGSGAGGSSASAKFGTVPGATLLGQAGLKAFAVQGESDKVELSTVAVTGQPFAEALRAHVKKGSGHEWAVQLQAPNAGPVDEG